MIGILNVEELVIGAFIGLLFSPWLHLWVIPVSIATSLLWALGGAGFLGTKAWRRIGIPMLLSLILLFHYNWLYLVISFLIGFGILTIGYGTPTIAPGRHDNDEGSPLGRFAVKLTGSDFWGGWLAKGILVGFLFLNYFIFLEIIK